MGSEAEVEVEVREEARKRRIRRSTAPQKLSLFSLPVPQQSSDPSGMLTPPFRPPASVPFLWEEAPGKPLLTSNSSSSSSSSSAIARCLELPPRLQLTEASNNTPSPTTVLDGPYVRRSSSFTSPSVDRDPPPLQGSFRRGTGSPEDSDGVDGIPQLGSLFHSKRRDVRSCSGRGYFGFSLRKAFFSSSSSSFNSKPNQDVGGEGNSISKVKISRIRSTGSFFSLSRTKSSHVWASIYEGFKQVVPWRNKMTKKDGLVD
ncbi:uncharacterized protein At4g00950-like [Telopea speciosissima]|uniref:uncharacterized protein At4g00950-like n=1 Tax=Telopea speciosissima TaxID=54955 RepID=UPI001CC74EF1|nr:uncharacterized protein At4g00950-like [Telopea speciosissima]